MFTLKIIFHHCLKKKKNNRKNTKIFLEDKQITFKSALVWPLGVSCLTAAVNGLHLDLAELVERESQGSVSPGFLMGPCGLHLIPDKPCIWWGWNCFLFSAGFYISGSNTRSLD